MITDKASLDSVPYESEYLNSVFSECGLQRGPGGKIEPMPAAVPLATVSRRHRDTMELDTASPALKRVKLDSYEVNDRASSTAVTSDNMKLQKSPTTLPRNKTKIYLLPPLDNPEEEKKRKNAVIARNNRILKKRQSEHLQKRVKQLEESNNGYYNNIQKLEESLRTHRKEERRANNMIAELQTEKHSLNILYQTQQEKLSFIREHLHLINGTLDEDNPTRKLLIALLERMGPSSSPAFASSAASPGTSSSHHDNVISQPYISSSYTTPAPCSISPSYTPPPCNISPSTTPRNISPYATPPHISPYATPPHISPYASPPCNTSTIPPSYTTPPHNISPAHVASTRNTSPSHCTSPPISCLTTSPVPAINLTMPRHSRS